MPGDESVELKTVRKNVNKYMGSRASVLGPHTGITGESYPQIFVVSPLEVRYYRVPPPLQRIVFLGFNYGRYDLSIGYFYFPS